MTYTLVPEKEANLKEGKISVDSPIAKGLLGKEVNEKADIQVPAGKFTFQIMDITVDTLPHESECLVRPFTKSLPAAVRPSKISSACLA